MLPGAGVVLCRAKSFIADGCWAVRRLPATHQIRAKGKGIGGAFYASPGPAKGSQQLLLAAVAYGPAVTGLPAGRPFHRSPWSDPDLGCSTPWMSRVVA